MVSQSTYRGWYAIVGLNLANSRVGGQEGCQLKGDFASMVPIVGLV